MLKWFEIHLCMDWRLKYKRTSLNLSVEFPIYETIPMALTIQHCGLMWVRCGAKIFHIQLTGTFNPINNYGYDLCYVMYNKNAKFFILLNTSMWNWVTHWKTSKKIDYCWFTCLLIFASWFSIRNIFNNSAVGLMATTFVMEISIPLLLCILQIRY